MGQCDSGQMWLTTSLFSLSSTLFQCPYLLMEELVAIGDSQST